MGEVTADPEAIRANEAGGIGAVHEGETGGKISKHAGSAVYKHLHNNIKGIAALNKTGFQHGEACFH